MYILGNWKDRLDVKSSAELAGAIAANAGILVTQVEFIKQNQDKFFAIVDAGMNDMLRPSLYQAWQKIIPVSVRDDDTPTHNFDIVGPVCETGDFLDSLTNLELLIVQDTFHSAITEIADIIIPSKTFAEKTGTYTNMERRVQLLNPAITGSDADDDCRILLQLARRMGYSGFEYNSPELSDIEILST